MKLELTEEKKMSDDRGWFIIKVDGYPVKLYANKEAAKQQYDNYLQKPDLLKSYSKILETQEISVSLEEPKNIEENGTTENEQSTTTN